MSTPAACCPGTTHRPPKPTLREALVKAGLAKGKRPHYYRDARQVGDSFDREQAEKLIGVLPGLEEQAR